MRHKLFKLVGCMDVFEAENLLIEYGDIGAYDNHGVTLLSNVCLWGDNSMLDIFLTICGKINFSSIIDKKDGNTPLHHACLLADDEDGIAIVRKLIQCGVDINKRNNAGLTPLRMVYSNINKEHYPADDIKFIVCNLLIDAGANPNIPDNKGNTIFHYACKNKDYRIVNHLIYLGADINAPNNNLDTPLHYACNCHNHNDCGNYDYRNYYYNIIILLNNGATIMSSNKQNEMPLDLLNNCYDHITAKIRNYIITWLQKTSILVYNQSEGSEASLFYYLGVILYDLSELMYPELSMMLPTTR